MINSNLIFSLRCDSLPTIFILEEKDWTPVEATANKYSADQNNVRFSTFNDVVWIIQGEFVNLTNDIQNTLL
jgi:hypothetical protein